MKIANFEDANQFVGRSYRNFGNYDLILNDR